MEYREIINLIDQNPQKIASIIDHTLLKPEKTPEEIEDFCREALPYHFAALCVHPTHVSLVARLLREEESAPKVGTVVGFPLGANLTSVKQFEAEQVLLTGAEEIDMVLNIGALKGEKHRLVEQDIVAVVQMAHQSNAICKVIIETALLTEDEKVQACKIVQSAGADFVKTATGFSGGGATVEDIALMRETVGPEMGVKAAGGIKSFIQARSMIMAGANRIGAGAGIEIVDSGL